MQRLLLGILLFLFVVEGQAAPAPKPEAYFLCKNRSNVRTIRVETDSDGHCSTKYTKEGKDNVVGQGRHVQSCKSFLFNIKSNLEEASWTCRKVKKDLLSFQDSPESSDVQ